MGRRRPAPSSRRGRRRGVLRTRPALDLFAGAGQVGDAWTFVGIDADSKLIAAYRVGKRDAGNTHEFIADLASRMRNKVQISTDGLALYVAAVEQSFGVDVDYAQVVKSYEAEHAAHDVGQKVRELMIKNTGVRPENIPLAAPIGDVKKAIKGTSKKFRALDGKKKKPKK